MKSIIEKIFFKELGFRERIPEDGKYQQANDNLCEAYEALEKTLNREQKELLSNLYDCMGQMESASECLFFKDGFQAGILLGIELCSQDE